MAGDRASTFGLLRAALFQSTPTNFMAGDSRPRSRARSSSAFQSTPTNFMAGDPSRGIQTGRKSCFNPRPPISWRATPGPRHAQVSSAVSIHAHQFHGGRRAHSAPTRGHLGVSIHAHQFHGGRPKVVDDAAWAKVFQSTPTNFMAGDPLVDDDLLEAAQVSIHAHQFHGGRPVSFVSAAVTSSVSIHAHQFHGGRRISAGDTADQCLFQSTPTNFMAGDDQPAGAHADPRRFNPRPPISWRATRPPSRS